MNLGELRFTSTTALRSAPKPLISTPLVTHPASPKFLTATEIMPAFEFLKLRT